MLVPSFLLILLGVVLKRRGGFGDAFWQGLESVTYYVFFPCLLFQSVARSSPAVLETSGLVVTAFAFTLAGAVLGYISKPMFRLDPRTFASSFQCAFRFSGYVGFAIMGGLYGESGIAIIALVTSLLVPPINALSILVLARGATTNWLREVVRNPLVVSTVAGLLFSLANLEIPVLADQTLKLLAAPALPLGLIAVGAGLRLQAVENRKGLVAYLLAVKLMAVPAVAFLAGKYFGLEGVHFATVLVLAALPTATNAYILTMKMGGDGQLVAGLVAANVAVAFATIPFWMVVSGI